MKAINRFPITPLSVSDALSFTTVLFLFYIHSVHHLLSKCRYSAARVFRWEDWINDACGSVPTLAPQHVFYVYMVKRCGKRGHFTFKIIISPLGLFRRTSQSIIVQFPCLIGRFQLLKVRYRLIYALQTVE